MITSVDNFDKKNISLVRQRNNYRIRYSMDKFIIELKNVYSPFGCEKYNNKDILNLSLIPKDNSDFNNIQFIKQINETFMNYSHPDFKNLEYSSFIKMSNNIHTIRTHLSNKLNINSPDKNFEIKNNTFNVQLEISSIWTFQNKFGLVLTVLEINQSS
jgi:hypothetical protein